MIHEQKSLHRLIRNNFYQDTETNEEFNYITSNSFSVQRCRKKSINIRYDSIFLTANRNNLVIMVVLSVEGGEINKKQNYSVKILQHLSHVSYIFLLGDIFVGGFQS